MPPRHRDRAILLMGATATGKTDLAVALVERFPVEIISVDSALIYRGMDIGTSKPEPEVLARAPHHLVDILDPAQSWSAWDFVHAARELIASINARGRIPLLVGGTMMYFNALQQGMNELPMADQAIRDELTQQLQEQGLAALHQVLQQIDPTSAARIKPSDPQRILRALEVYRASGQPLSELLARQRDTPDIDYQRIILEVTDRQHLHDRIALRFRHMLEAGFEHEVETLRARGDLNPGMPSMRCVGYRQVWHYLDGEYDRQEMIAKAVAATRQLAKRQLTWLRKYQDVLKLDYKQVSLDQVTETLGLTPVS